MAIMILMILKGITGGAMKHAYRVGVAAATAAIVLLAFAACKNAAGNTFRQQERFTGKEYEIVIANPIPNGTIRVIPNTKIAYQEDTVILTLQPDDGYWPEAVSVKRQDTDEALLLTSRGNTRRSFVMPASDVTVTASFSQTPPDGPEPPASRPGLIFSSGYFFNTAVLTEKDCQVSWYCDDIEGINGGQVIRVGPEYGGQGGGFSITVSAESAIDLNGTMNALSFWARSPDAISIQYVTVGAGAIGHGGDYAVSYTGEDNKGISIDDEWTRVIVPIPKRVSVHIDEIFDLWIPASEEGRVLYIDEIELISVSLSIDRIDLREPDEISPSGRTPVSKILRGMKVVYSVDQTPVSLFNENVQFENYHTVQYQAVGAAQIDDDMLVTQSGGGVYAFTVTLDAKQGQVSGTVSNTRFLIIEDCTRTGRIWEWTANPGGYYTQSWYSAFEEAADGPYLTIMNRSDSGDWGWKLASITRKEFRSAPMDLRQYTEITFRARALAPGLKFYFRFIVAPDDGSNLFDARYWATGPLEVSNLWKEFTIPLRNFRLGANGTAAWIGDPELANIGGWEIGTEESPFENFLYIGPFKVR